MVTRRAAPLPPPPAIVLVVRGPHKGRVGYYDDDDCLVDAANRMQRRAVVYFDRPFLDGYHLVPHASLVETDAAHLPTQQFLRQHPELAAQLGMEV